MKRQLLTCLLVLSAVTGFAQKTSARESIASVAADSLIWTTDNDLIFKGTVKFYSEKNKLMDTQHKDVTLPRMLHFILDGKEQEKGKYIYIKEGTALTLQSMSSGGLESKTIKLH